MSWQGFYCGYSNTYGDNNLYTPINKVNTGTKALDYVLGIGASTLNLLGAGINVISNGIGAIGEVVKIVDDNLDPHYTLTGAGIQADLDALSVVAVTNPQLIADGLSCLKETANYLSTVNAIPLNENNVILHEGAQGKHIKGHSNYQEGKSVFNGSMVDAQRLLNKFSGNGQKISETKERVNFEETIGYCINPETGESIETSWGIIHSGKNGSHIVPSMPID